MNKQFTTLRVWLSRITIAPLALSIGTIIIHVPGAEADPLMNRTGQTLTVTINGTETTKVPSQDISDSTGLKPYTVNWSSALAEGPLCLKLKTLDERLGKAERIDVLIHEVRTDRPHQQWKSYKTVPSTTEALTQFEQEKGFCPSEYILTERLRYPTLPTGDYVMRVSYWGVGNWDRQDILLSVKK